MVVGKFKRKYVNKLKMIPRKVLRSLVNLVLVCLVLVEGQAVVQKEITEAQAKFYVYIFVPLTAVAVLIIGFCVIKLARQDEGELGTV